MDDIKEQIAHAYNEWQKKLNDAGGHWGHVTICAVTKTVPPDIMNIAFDAGIRDIGENRAQELMQKLPVLKDGFNIHHVGQLQSNKVKYIIARIDMIQSVDRMPLGREISERATRINRVVPVLVQVNIAAEPQKGGVSEGGLPGLIKGLSSLEGISVKGLMAVMPLVDDPEDVRMHFRKMKLWFDRIKLMGIPRVDMETLSMGMSGDCLVAAQEGATMVRLGTALFKNALNTGRQM
jgi:pyridoxal phosphate enzyme (YggS family)